MKLVRKGHDYGYEMLCLAMLFFPGEKLPEGEAGEEEDQFLTERIEQGEELLLRVKAVLGGKTAEESRSIPAGTPDAQQERIFGVLGYHCLSQLTEIRPKWGILTGIRPVKVLQRALDSGLSREEAAEVFRSEYLVSDEKLALAMATQRTEHEILSRSTPDSFSLYISIPFCPSRCLYCSFVSHSIEKTLKLIPEYVKRLCEEIRVTAQKARALGLTLRTVYFGGGTPTSISAAQLKQITDQVAESFDLSGIWEYTIEAGRPDTITREKLEVIRNACVTRISINPQTLNDEVLRTVGRNHTAQDVIDAFSLAREVGFDNINMDLIAGLPTETPESFEHSLQGILKLAPENITVHTLSVKRAADLAQSVRGGTASQARIAQQMVDYASDVLPKNGYAPYYLYRQRNTLDNLENTGYCKPGTEGLYNVYIMDETHTILACGAGAVSKLCNADGTKIERVYNYKYPYEYLSRFEEMLARKETFDSFYRKYPL